MAPRDAKRHSLLCLVDLQSRLLGSLRLGSRGDEALLRGRHLADTLLLFEKEVYIYIYIYIIYI